MIYVSLAGGCFYERPNCGLSVWANKLKISCVLLLTLIKEILLIGGWFYASCEHQESNPAMADYDLWFSFEIIWVCPWERSTPYGHPSHLQNKAEIQHSSFYSNHTYTDSCVKTLPAKNQIFTLIFYRKRGL